MSGYGFSRRYFGSERSMGILYINCMVWFGQEYCGSIMCVR
jgi:hypothetical protein